jgi:hypothetical protein
MSLTLSFVIGGAALAGTARAVETACGMATLDEKTDDVVIVAAKM